MRGRGREAERKREMKRKLAEEDEGNYPVYENSLCIVHGGERWFDPTSA